MKGTDPARHEVVIAFPKDSYELTWEDVRAMGLHAAPSDEEFELYDDESLMGGNNGDVLIIRQAADGTIISTRPYGPKPTVVLTFRKKR